MWRWQWWCNGSKRETPDGSIWPTGSAAHMQEVIRMHETFCNFHQIYIHKKKSEYVSINAGGAQVRWTPTGRDTTPKGEEHKQHLETKEGREEMQKEQRLCKRSTSNNKSWLNFYNNYLGISFAYFDSQTKTSFKSVTICAYVKYFFVLMVV